MLYPAELRALTVVFLVGIALCSTDPRDRALPEARDGGDRLAGWLPNPRSRRRSF